MEAGAAEITGEAAVTVTMAVAVERTAILVGVTNVPVVVYMEPVLEGITAEVALLVRLAECVGLGAAGFGPLLAGERVEFPNCVPTSTPGVMLAPVF